MVGNIHIMGIVNLTPDSFYAGSRVQADAALERIQSMREEGADVIDLGACSTRPGSPQPSLEEEWRRLEPVLTEIAGKASLTNTPRTQTTSFVLGPAKNLTPCTRTDNSVLGTSVSIDTYRSEIVRRVYDTIGPFIVNDISTGQMDEKMLETVGRLGLPYVAMHMRGTPETMQSLTDYEDVTRAVIDYFKEFTVKAEEAGIKEWILDPGFGFSKTLPQNYELLERLDEVVKAFPEQEMLIGVSRKSMIYKKLGITPDEAMPATQVVQFAALEKGATWLRVHDVAAAVNTAKLYSTIYTSSPGAAK
jgi:dihydropteroate synthase